MNILITGGAGFIGSNLALRLIAMGHTVTVLDALASQIHGENPEQSSPLYRTILGRMRIIVGSVCDRPTWLEAISGQEIIVHLAAETGTGQSMYEIKRYVDVNIGGTALMLDLLANQSHSVRKVIVASSRAIYGEGKYFSKALGIVYPLSRTEQDLKAARFDLLCPQTREPLEVLPTDEDSAIHPTSVYGITKQTQEQMVITVCGSLGLAGTALRYQNVYGPGQSLSNPYTGILSIFSTRMLNGNPINIFEDGKESRDFVYIDDVVEATVAAMFRPEAEGEVFGIGSGVATTVMDVALALAKQYESKVPIRVTGDYRLGDIRHNYADTRKASKLLGFESMVKFVDGIRRFAEWVREQTLPADRYDASVEEMKAKGLLKSS
jgi:dTDP-L-rhamnose 4-epimerase